MRSNTFSSFFFFLNFNAESQREKSNRSGSIFLTESISSNTLLWQGHLLFGRRFLQWILQDAAGPFWPPVGIRSEPDPGSGSTPCRGPCAQMGEPLGRAPEEGDRAGGGEELHAVAGQRPHHQEVPVVLNITGVLGRVPRASSRLFLMEGIYPRWYLNHCTWRMDIHPKKHRHEGNSDLEEDGRPQ